MAIIKVASAGLGSGVGGKVLQVVSATKTDVFQTSSSSFVDVTGLSVSITPASTSNRTTSPNSFIAIKWASVPPI